MHSPKKPVGVFTFALVTLCAFGASASAQSPITWFTEPRLACSQESNEQNKDVLLLLTANTWLPASSTLTNSLLSQASPLQSLHDTFLFSTIDIPDMPEGKARDILNRNRDYIPFLRKYPAIILLTPNGKPYAEIIDLEASNLPEQISRLQQAKQASEKAAEKAQTTRSQRAKLRLLEQSYRLLKDAGALTADAERALISADTQKQSGVARELTFPDQEYFTSRIEPYVKMPHTAEHALATIDRELAHPDNTPLLQQRLLGMRFHIFKSTEDLDKAKETLQRLIALAPETPLARGAENYLHYIDDPIVLKNRSWDPGTLRFFFATWRADLSGEIKQPDNYQIDFVHRHPSEPIEIQSVSLVTTQGEVLVEAQPVPGHPLRFTISIKEPVPDCWLSASVKGTGKFLSYGEIQITPSPN